MGTKIYNSDLTQNLIDGAKIQIVTDSVPSELAEKVVPVMETNPRLLRVANIVKQVGVSTSANGTLYTTPTDQDFYLTSVQLSWSKDATCDAATSPSGPSINVTIDGIGTSLIKSTTTTLIAQDFSLILAPSIPIKIDRGTAITVANIAYSAGNMVKVGALTGYLVKNIRA